jgi:hypothetical protein
MSEAQDTRVREIAAAHAPKHTRLIRSAKHGQILSAAMLPFVRALPWGGYGVITTTGRTTGRARPKCVRVIRKGDKAYLVQLRPRAGDLPPLRRLGVGLEHLEPERDPADPGRDLQGRGAGAG